MTGLNEFGLYLLCQSRESTEPDKATSFGLGSYSELQLTPRAILWAELTAGHNEKSRHMTTTEFLQKGEKVAAIVRGAIRSQGYPDDTAKSHLFTDEFWGRLVQAVNTQEVDQSTQNKRPHQPATMDRETKACCAFRILDLQTNSQKDAGDPADAPTQNETESNDELCCHNRILDIMVRISLI